MSGIRPRLPGSKALPVRASHWLYRKAYEEPRRRDLRRRFLRRPLRWDELSASVGEVHSLLCHRDVEMALCAATSFAIATRSCFDWLIHDDGSLTAEDVGWIERQVPCATVIRRAEADARAAVECAQFERILEYRRRQVMALKLVDVRLWARSARIAYLDSDICFFERPDFLLEALQGSRRGSYFNRDIDDAYVLDRSEIGRRLGVTPYERVNAGLWVMNRDDLALPTIEGWLRHPGFQDCLYGYTLDQTMISMLATLGRDGVAHLPRAYDVDLQKGLTGSVTKHYVGAIRHGFELEGIARLLAGTASGLA